MKDSDSTRIITVGDWPKFHPWPSQSALRHLIHRASENGFDAVVRRIGGRILINEAAFFEWVEQRGRGGE